MINQVFFRSFFLYTHIRVHTVMLLLFPATVVHTWPYISIFLNQVSNCSCLWWGNRYTWNAPVKNNCFSPLLCWNGSLQATEHLIFPLQKFLVGSKKVLKLHRKEYGICHSTSDCVDALSLISCQWPIPDASERGGTNSKIPNTTCSWLCIALLYWKKRISSCELHWFTPLEKY